MTRTLFTRTLAAAVLAAASASPASAQNLRCKNDFAERGDAKITVLTKCGEPVLKDSHCRPDPEPPASGIQRTCTVVDTWAYRPGSGQFITLLDFENGVLKAIRYGDRIP